MIADRYRLIRGSAIRNRHLGLWVAFVRLIARGRGARRGGQPRRRWSRPRVGERLTGAGAWPSPSASKIGRALGGTGWTPCRHLSRRRRGAPPTPGSSSCRTLADQVSRCRRPTCSCARTSRRGAPDPVRPGVAAQRVARPSGRAGPRGHRSAAERALVATAAARRRRDDEVASGAPARGRGGRAGGARLGPVAARLRRAGQLREAQAGADRARRDAGRAPVLRAPRRAARPAGRSARSPPRAGAGCGRCSARPPAARCASCAAGWTPRSGARRHARGAALHEVRKAAKQVRYTAEIGRGEVARLKKVVRVAKTRADRAGRAPGHRRHPGAVPPVRRGGRRGRGERVSPTAGCTHWNRRAPTHRAGLPEAGPRSCAPS